MTIKIKLTNGQNLVVISSCAKTVTSQLLPLIVMSYKLIQPAVNIGIGIGIGTADLIANIFVYLQYRQIVV